MSEDALTRPDEQRAVAEKDAAAGDRAGDPLARDGLELAASLEGHDASPGPGHDRRGERVLAPLLEGCREPQQIALALK